MKSQPLPSDCASLEKQRCPAGFPGKWEDLPPGLCDVGDRPSRSVGLLDWAMLGTGPLSVSWAPGLSDVGDRPSRSEWKSWTGRCWGQALSQ